MRQGKLLIGIRTLDELEKETVAAFKKAAAGTASAAPAQRLYFADQNTLFSALSPKRMALLKFLRQNGPMSIRKLAKLLDRDYKNVHTDVTHLFRLGLVKKKQADKVYVPWDDITIELALAA